MPVNVSKKSRVLRNPTTGRLTEVPATEADAIAAREGLEYATLDQIRASNEREEFGGLGQTALGAAELFGEAATLGLYSPEGDDAESRRRVLRRDSPFVAAGAELTGTVLPGVLAGAGAAAGVARVAGAGSKALLAGRAASAVAEGGVSAFAQERVSAREEGRDIDVGNILLYGVGGEILGRAVPGVLSAGLRRVSNRLDAVAPTPTPTPKAVTLTEPDNVLVQAEAAAVKSDVVEGIPAGPDRDHFLRDNAEELTNDASLRVREAMDRASDRFSDLGDVRAKRAKIEKLVGPDHPAQAEWMAEQVERIQIARDEIQGLASVPGLQGVAKKLDAFLDDAQGRLTGSRRAADKFMAANEIKQGLQKYYVFLGRSQSSAQDAAYHQQMKSVVEAVQEPMRQGLELESLWGRAGRFQADVNSAWHNRWFPGAQVTEQDLSRITGRDYEARKVVEYDPAKIRSFLEKDEVGRGLTQENLGRVLDGYQEMAEAHRKWGISATKDLDALLADVDAVRKAIATADEIRVAKRTADAADAAERAATKQAREEAREAARQAKEEARESARRAREESRDAAALERETARQAREEARAEAAAEAASDQLTASIVPVLGPIFIKAKQMIRNIDTAGKSKTRRAGAWMATGFRASAKATRAVSEHGGGALATGVLGLSRKPVETRFQGEYPTLTQAFQAKRKQIETALQQPDRFAEAVAGSLGDLPESMPLVHARLAQRLALAVNYLAQNMPPGIETGLAGKHSTPPDVRAIRKFSQLWEAVMNPGAVVDDFATMHATVEQARAIEAVHPDVFSNLRDAAIIAVAESVTPPSYERMRYLDQMFRLGGLLGSVWRPSVSRNIQASLMADIAPSQGNGPPSTLEGQTGPSPPSSMNAISSGPTLSAS